MTNAGLSSLQGQSWGFGNIPVLEFLNGLPYNHLTQCYIRALRPSSLRIISNGGAQTLDGKAWRVTVYLEDDVIDHITQEVQVALYDDIENGHDLYVKLEQLKKEITHEYK